MKRLIVNADDLGYSAGIDAGILRAYRDGIVTSTLVAAYALCEVLASIAAEGDIVSELMCHPSEPDPELEARSTYARQRYRELASLVDPVVRAKVDELGLVLSTFRDVR